MGTSLGGLIAQVLAARHPDCIDRLILSSTWKVNKSPLEVNADAFRTLASYRADTASNAPKIAEFFFPPDCLRDRPELIEIFRGNSRDDGQKARRGAILAQMVGADLSNFDRPTLLLAGSEDRLIPNAETFAIARDLKRVETRVIEQVGHVSSIQAPERVAEAAIAFLTSRKEGEPTTRGEQHG
jgi:3-oxoadipate enol-lactonase